MVVLFLPMAQHFLKIFHTHRLDGAFAKPPRPTENPIHYTNQEERAKLAEWVKYKFGFMPDFVRLRNQINYWLFDEVNALLSLGKDEVIFDANYIFAATGKDSMPKDTLQKMVAELRLIYDSAQVSGKSMAILLAPNKALYYPNSWPKRNYGKAGPTNHVRLKNELDSLDIPTVDFNEFILARRDTAALPLFPKHAAHWSYYGAYLAMDSLFHWMNAQHDFGLSLKLQTLEARTEPQYPDNDYAGALNLIIPFSEGPLGYPEYTFSGKVKPKVLFIGDSFFWNWSYLNITQQAFHPSSLYFYYNTTVYNMNRDKLKPLDNTIALRAFQEADYIFFITGDPNIKNMLPGVTNYWAKLLKQQSDGI